MIALLIYRSDEVCPFAIHLCDSYQQCADGDLVIRKDDTVSTIVDYGYYHALGLDPGEEHKMVERMKGLARAVLELNNRGEVNG